MIKKILIGILVAAAIFATVYLIVDAASAHNGQYVELDLPAVNYLNYDDFFAANGSFQIASELPAISQNLAKVVGYDEDYFQSGSSLQIYPNFCQFYSTKINQHRYLKFMPLVPGDYILRYVVSNVSESTSANFRWRTNSADSWNNNPGDWSRPVTFHLDAGDQLEVKLFNHNGKEHFYNIWFYIVPVSIDTSAMKERDIMTEPYVNQIGKVVHKGNKYYQIQDPDYEDYYIDYTVLEQLGTELVTPDINYYYYKIFKTSGDRWRIMWRDQSALTNPLIYENGFFYVEEPAGAYYSEDTYETIAHALVALSSKKTKYSFDAIRRYENAYSSEAIEFFDPENNDLFWNYCPEEIFPGTFYKNFNPSHYDQLVSMVGSGLLSYNWRMPAAFSFQNYTEQIDLLPLELQRSMQRGFFQDLGSYFVGGYNKVTGWIRSTATTVYSQAENAYATVKSFVVDKTEHVVSTVESTWQTIENGASSFVTSVTTSSNQTFDDFRDVVMEVVKPSTGDAWWDSLYNLFDSVDGDKSPFRDIYLLFKDKFAFITDIQATVERLLSVFDTSTYAVQRPPVIYANFEESESEYFQGMGQVAVSDFSWYARYKPYVDTFLAAILWGFFLFRLYMRLPDIISGVGSAFDAYAEDAPKPRSKNKIGF